MMQAAAMMSITNNSKGIVVPFLLSGLDAATVEPTFALCRAVVVHNHKDNFAAAARASDGASLDGAVSGYSNAGSGIHVSVPFLVTAKQCAHRSPYVNLNTYA